MTTRSNTLTAMGVLAMTATSALAQTAKIVPENHECVRGQTYQITLETASATTDPFHAQTLPSWEPEAGKRYRGPRLDWNELEDENYLTIADRCGGFELELYIHQADRGWQVEGGRTPGEVILENLKPTVLIQRMSRYIGERAKLHDHGQRVTVRTELGKTRPYGKLIKRLNRCHNPSWRSADDPRPRMTIKLETKDGRVVDGGPMPGPRARGSEAPTEGSDPYRFGWLDTLERCQPLRQLPDGKWTIQIRNDRVTAIEAATD